MRSKRRTKPNGIILDDQFRIFYKDDLNLELQEFVTFVDNDEQTQTEWRGRGYFSSIPSAFKKYCKLKQNRCTSISALVSTMGELADKIDNLFNWKTNGCTCKKEKKG